MSIDHSSIAQEVERRFGAFFREKINPSAMVRDQTYSTFDEETLHEMGRLGLIGFTAARSIGGQGRTWEEWGHALEEIGLSWPKMHIRSKEPSPRMIILSGYSR
jgi:alkylation response protein AidB-like acyl-CoA dehydrogenase